MKCMRTLTMSFPAYRGSPEVYGRINMRHCNNRMFMKEPHTALFVAPNRVGKTPLALSLLETEYRNHFDFMVIICPTLRYNSMYKSRSWVWNDPDVIPIEPGNQLYYLTEKISNLLTGDKTLFLIDDIIADETLDKHWQPLLELAILRVILYGC